MNVVFLSPHFPPNFWLFARALKQAGAKVLALADTPYDSLSADLKPHLHDFVHVPQLSEHEQALKAVGLLVSRHGRVHRIESLNEHWLSLEAKLRDDFNVFGPREAQVALWQDKLRASKLFRDAGVPTPETEPLTSVAQVQAFAKRVGWPVVAKPITGVGSKGVFQLRSDEDAAVRLATIPAKYVVQPFIEGRIVTYDGVVDRTGQVAFAFSLEYSTGVMEVLRDGLDMSFWTHRELSPALVHLGTRALEALGLKERWFHLEMFRLAGGRYTLLEANLRPPGGFIPDMMNYTVDADVAQAWAQVVVKGETPALPEPKWHVSHVARRTSNRYQHTLDEVKSKLGEQLVWHRVLPALFSGGMGDEMYLLRTRTLPELRDATEYVQALAG